MSVISAVQRYAIRAKYLIERWTPDNVDDENAPTGAYQDVNNGEVWGFSQPKDASPSTAALLAGEQFSKVFYDFYCLPEVIIRRGDRITRKDLDNYPVLFVLNVRPMMDIQVQIDHLKALCEERQEGFKLE